MVLRSSARVLSIASTLVLLLFLFGEPFNVSSVRKTDSPAHAELIGSPLPF